MRAGTCDSWIGIGAIVHHSVAPVDTIRGYTGALQTAQLLPWGRGAPPGKNHRAGPRGYRRKVPGSRSHRGLPPECSASPGASSIAKSPASPADSPVSASRPATAPASGPATASSGSSCNTPPPAPASSWSTSTPPTARTNCATFSRSPVSAPSSSASTTRAPTIASSSTNRATATRSRSNTSVWLGDTSWDAMLAGGRDFPARYRRPARRRQHTVHLRHHRLAQRRAAHSPQPAQQRHGDLARPRAPRNRTASARPCPSTTASDR